VKVSRGIREPPMNERVARTDYSPRIVTTISRRCAPARCSHR
jgi:hypothetical protein